MLDTTSPSAQPNSSPDAQPTAAPSGDAGLTSLGGGLGQNTDGLTEAKPGSTEIGGNGGPDWRALIAGDDPKGIEMLARFKQPGDLLKSYREAQTKISQKSGPVSLPENATPEQIGEYRKGLGLPEIQGDAKPDAYMQAYGIKAPEGYAMSEVEKGMLSDFTREAYEKGMSPREVKASADFFFKQQAASMQALNKISADRHKQWDKALKSELGDQYDDMVAAGNSFMKAQFADNEEGMHELLNATLPGGGLLGNHPVFIKLLTDLALQNGYTDRIEATSLESNGKSLAAQQSEIEKLMHSDRAAYNRPETQDRLKKIISLRQSRGEIDEWGNERKR